MRGAAALPGGGPVWSVCFDRGGAFTPRGAGDAGVPRVLAATQGGLLAACAPGPGAAGELLLPGEAAAVAHLALDPSAGAELVALTHAEALLHWDRTREEDELA